MQHNNHQWLIEGSIGKILVNTTAPMLVAIFLLFAYDVLESQLLSQISLEALTALGFTVPVTTAMVAFAIAMTITTNTSVTKILSQDSGETPTVVLNALILAVMLSLFLSLLAYGLNQHIFKFLGIDYAMLPDSFHLGPRPQLLPLIEGYMNWRYLGWVFLVLIWQVNSLLRAVGLIHHASGVFILWMSSKIILALWLFNGEPNLEAIALENAALVHFVCDSTFALIGLIILFQKLSLRSVHWQQINPIQTFKQLSIVGLPATLQQLLTPLSITLLTILVVAYGQVYVAMLGIIFRLEVLLLLVPMVLTTALPSIIGVNWWSGHYQRVSQFLFHSKVTVVVAQFIIAMILFVNADTVAQWFSSNEHIQYNIQSYLKIVPIGFIGAGITIICQSSFNATGHYIKASALSVTHRMVLKLSCCYIGLSLNGIEGLFVGILSAHLLSALVTVMLTYRSIFRFQPQS